MKYTHKGIVNMVGKKQTTLLRESKRYWIMPSDESGYSGLKFRKTDGTCSDPQSSVMCKLYLTTIKSVV